MDTEGTTSKEHENIKWMQRELRRETKTYNGAKREREWLKRECFEGEILIQTIEGVFGTTQIYKKN